MFPSLSIYIKLTFIINMSGEAAENITHVSVARTMIRAATKIMREQREQNIEHR